MILKFYELNKIDISKQKFHLFYGNNEGLKREEILKLCSKSKKKIFKFDEKQILENTENFFNDIYSGSLFENEKFIVINHASEKILKIIQEILEEQKSKINTVIFSGDLFRSPSQVKWKRLLNEYKDDFEIIIAPGNHVIGYLHNDPKRELFSKEILKLEENHPFLINKNSPSESVGFKPSKIFKKVEHKSPMLSLSNVFTEEDLINFEKKIHNYLDQNRDFEIEYSAEPKIDGISASLIYINGKFETGLSRGDGKLGEDITANLKTINDIPKNISDKEFPKEIDIRGEVFIQNSDFKKLANKFANPRNAASGSLRQKNPQETKKIPLKFIAYTFGFEKDLIAENQS